MATNNGTLEVPSKRGLDALLDRFVAELEAKGATITAEMRQLLEYVIEAAQGGIGVVEIEDVVGGDLYHSVFLRAPGAMTVLHKLTTQQGLSISEIETALEVVAGEVALRARKTDLDATVGRALTLTTLSEAVSGASVALLPVEPLTQSVGLGRTLYLRRPAAAGDDGAGADEAGLVQIVVAEAGSAGAEELVVEPQELDLPAGTQVLLPLSVLSSDLLVKVNQIAAQVAQSGGGSFVVGRLATALADGSVTSLPLDALTAPVSPGDVLVFESADGTTVSATVAAEVEPSETPVAVAVNAVTVPGGAEAETPVSYSLLTLIARLELAANGITLSAARALLGDLAAATALTTVTEDLTGTSVTSIAVEALSAEAATAVKEDVALVLYDVGTGTQTTVTVSASANAGDESISIQPASPVAATGSPVLLPVASSVAILRILADAIEATVTSTLNQTTPVASLDLSYADGSTVGSLRLSNLDLPLYGGNVVSVVNDNDDVETYEVVGSKYDATSGTVDVNVVDKTTAGLTAGAVVSLTPRQIVANFQLQADEIILSIETGGSNTYFQLVPGAITLAAGITKIIGAFEAGDVLIEDGVVHVGSATILTDDKFRLTGGTKAVDITTQAGVAIQPFLDLVLSSDDGNVHVQGAGGTTFLVDIPQRITNDLRVEGLLRVGSAGAVCTFSGPNASGQYSFDQKIRFQKAVEFAVSPQFSAVDVTSLTSSNDVRAEGEVRSDQVRSIGSLLSLLGSSVTVETPGVAKLIGEGGVELTTGEDIVVSASGFSGRLALTTVNGVQVLTLVP